MKFLQRINQNPILVFILLLKDIYEIIKNILQSPHTTSIMQHIDFFDIGIKVFLCIYIYSILKKYKRIKELMQVSHIVQLYNAYRSHTDSIQATPNTIQGIMKQYQLQEKEAVKKQIAKKYPHKTSIEIEQLVEEYYNG